MRLTASLLSVLALATSAHAGSTAWQEIAPGARARLVTSDVRAPDGTTLVGLELDMPAGTKTYWRVPGETGIPTEFDLLGSKGVVGHEVMWPFPTVDTAKGYLDYVYYGPTVLPLKLRVEDGAGALEASVTLGVCSDICVPAVVRFSFPLQFDEPDAGQRIRLQQAAATAILPWEGEGEPVGHVSYDRQANALRVAVDASIADPSSLVADLGDSSVLFGAPQKSPDGRSLFIPVMGDTVGGGLEGRSIRLTFMTDNGPFELTRTIGAGASTEATQ